MPKDDANRGRRRATVESSNNGCVVKRSIQRVPRLRSHMRLVQVTARVSALRVTLGIVSLALLGSACQATGTAATGQAPSGTSVTVGVVPAVDNAPLRVAADDGLFSAHGLNVTIKTYSSLSLEIKALTSGQIDIAAGNYFDFFYEQAAGGEKLHLIAEGNDATSTLREPLTTTRSGV